MKTKIEIELKPFEVPEYVQAMKDPLSRAEGVKFPLTLIDASTLDEMCDDFRIAVFKRAKKLMPTDCRIPPPKDQSSK